MTNRLPLIAVFLCVVGCCTSAYSQTYNFYFGDIHSHTWYSDGNQDQTPSLYTLPVARGMTYAKSSGNMNFLGISDHNHTDGGFPMTLALWRSGMHEADSLNQDGTFACMYGQEWGVISGGGHVLIYGTDKLFGWNPGVYDVFVTKSNYPMLWDSVRTYGGFAYLAHPASTDYGGIFTNPYNAMYDSVVRGCAIRNGPATSTVTDETATNTTSYEARYHDLLRLGYHVAPCANQDNHNTTYGRVNQQRTVVLATSLTRANVVDALRNRRAYATEDHNLQLDFEVGTHVMGEMFTQAGPIPIKVKVTDPDGAGLVSTIQIRYGVPGSGAAPATLTSVSGQDSLVFSQPQGIGTTYYYYAYVQETSGRRAWSAPMWITVPTGPLPDPFTLSAPPNTSVDQPVSGTLRWASSANAAQYDVYLDGNNPPTTLVSSNQADTTYSYSGLLNNTPYHWKVIAKNTNGTVVASGAPWHFTTIVAAPGAFLHVTPADASVNQPVAGMLSWQSSSNAAGYDVYLDTGAVAVTLVSSSQPGNSYGYSGLLNSQGYSWKVVARNAAGTLDALNAPTHFTTIGPSPGAFALASPPDSALSQPLTGTLRWNVSPFAVSYDVYLDVNDPPAVRIDSNRTDTTFNYSLLVPGQTYHWKIVAKNANDVTVASNAPHTFGTANVPVAATDVVASPVTVSAIHLHWTDNASDETGYRVYRSLTGSGPFVQVGGDLPANTTSFADSGLAINQMYYYHVAPFNGLGEGNAASLTRATLAVAPGAPAISNVTYTSVSITIDTAQNPSGTEFALRATLDTARSYVQSDGTLGLSPVWRTTAQWGSPVPVTGLHACKTYSFDLIARNLDQVETSFGPASDQTLPCFVSDYAAGSGWNLMSLPVLVTDVRKSVVYPSATSGAFFYQGSYVASESLRYGKGFWLKVGSAGNLSVSGEPRMSDTVSINAGWNIIGSLSTGVSVGSIAELPSPIVVSKYFGYDGGYAQADSLRPMRGYWVKSSAAGKLVLGPGSVASAKAGHLAAPESESPLTTLTFEDRAGHRQSLPIGSGTGALKFSELPPLPPAEAFDVRASSGSASGINLSGMKAGTRIALSMQGVQYPVRVTLSGPIPAGKSLSVADGSRVLPLNDGTVELAGVSGQLAIVVSNAGSPSLPKETRLYQNYPNPFNPSTEIRYDLAADARVRLSIVNLLGQTVATLIDGQVPAGSYSSTWTADVAGGVYFMKLEVHSDAGETAPFTQIRKIIFLK